MLYRYYQRKRWIQPVAHCPMLLQRFVFSLCFSLILLTLLYDCVLQVLTMQGYGREADLWSVGVIMFLLLCGKLPFDGDDHNEIIRSTIQVGLLLLLI